jgi:beta-lactamase regulating signal transducer with metallopeptidase domain
VSTLLILSSMLLVTLGSCLMLGLMHHLGDWSQRRKAQGVVLAAPLVSLAISIGDLCLHGIAPWDSLLSAALPLTMGLVALGALGLGIVRLALLAQVMARYGGRADAALQARVDDLAKRLCCVPPRVLLCRSDRPLAVTYGLRRPVVLLSTWMPEHFDERELEAVLVHELEHVARRDYCMLWVATILRDAFFYVPTTWIAYRQLQQEKELACDDVVVGATHRPLALASALTKVWLHALNAPACGQFSAAQSLVGAEKTIDHRIKRLLTPPEPPAQAHRARASIFRMSMAALVTFLLPGLVNVMFMFLLMGCSPALLPGKLF